MSERSCDCHTAEAIFCAKCVESKDAELKHLRDSIGVLREENRALQKKLHWWNNSPSAPCDRQEYLRRTDGFDGGQMGDMG